MDTITRQIEFVVEHCCNCHVPFAMTRDTYNRRREDHKTFYCPNGHPQVYTGKSELQRAREEIDRQKRTIEWERERTKQARDERDRKEYERRAAVGQVTKIKKRIGRGVCPCCNRTFENLARHMSNQHPEYTEAPDAGRA